MSEATPAVSTSGYVSTQPYRPPFLQSPGRPPIPWQRWLAMFEDWLLAIGFPETEAMVPRKAAILRASLGTEGFRIYTSLTTNPREAYDDAVARLATHFGQPASTIFNRAQFTRRQQRSGESVTQYIAALREMASKCEFAAAQLDERVRDQFVAWACCDRIRERLLQEPANRTLDELVSIAVTIERDMAEAPALSSGNQPSASVGHVFSRRDRPSSPSSSGCGNCGRDGHTARCAECPARGQLCRSCGKYGHFSSKCRSSATTDRRVSGRTPSRYPGQVANRRRSKSNHRRSNRRSVRANKIDDDMDSAADAVNSVTISSVQVCKPGAFKQVRCNLAHVPVDFILDLGAKVSIISRAQYESSSLRLNSLQPSDVTLRTYSGQPIACLGRIQLPVSLGETHLPSFNFYVTAKGESVMGVDLFDALGGSVQLGDTSLISRPIDAVMSLSLSTTSVSLADYPTLTNGFGRLKGFVHRPHIDLSVRPVQQKFYHQPLALRQPISDELQRMERDGIFERSDTSVWMSNIVVARKKSGGVRICVNLSDVNKALIPQRYPLPTMEELTEQIAGATVFSKLDLAWGYLQLELAEECRYITAFVSHEGVFQFRSLPFGLTSGPSAFQQVVRIITELPGCVNILDDLLIWGRDMAEHDARLRNVLDRLAKYGATLRVEKCVLGQPEVDFNGHRVSANGVRPLQSNVAALKRIPPPTNQRQLSRFVGAATYYAKFVPLFAELCRPFRPLLKSNSEWAWSTDCQQAFDTIKEKIASPPTLAHFDVSADETLVTCDASASALGACLSQKVGDVERPIAFASRVLSPAERKYSASEREALACLWACEFWHFYLYGRRFTLVTDHQALKTLLTTGGSGHRPLRLHRWSDRLFQYSFDVQFRPGRENNVADCLSRSFDDSAVAAEDVTAAAPTLMRLFPRAIFRTRIADATIPHTSYQKNGDRTPGWAENVLPRMGSLYNLARC
jgi:hypothetical protein